MKSIYLTISAFMIVSIMNAQPWIYNISEKSNQRNFYEIQKEFNKYWKSKEVEKGKGWKQFKRWEHFMETRVDKNGLLPKSILWQEYLKQKQNKTTTGSWIHLGPVDTPTDINYGNKRGSGRVNCIEFHPTDPNIFWVGAPSGGLWKTTDAGSNWATTTDDLPSIGFSDIAVDPTNSNVLYAATGDGDASDTYSIGILKTTDGGVTWNSTGLSHNITDYYTFRRILVNPNSTSLVLATSSGGIYRSADAGANWSNVISGNFKDLEFKPGNPNIVYATEYGYAGNAAIYKSIDGGVNWSSISSGLSVADINRIELAVTPDNANVLYALCSDQSSSGYYGLYKSSNEGASWTLMSDYNDINLMGWSEYGDDSGGQGWYDLSLAVSPTNENEVYVGGVNIWKSLDGGSNWNINAHWYGAGGSEYVHADQHTFDFNPLNNVLYSGNDGGIYKTANGGGTWTDISDGLEILQIYRMGTSYTDSNIVVTGAQDNGSMKMDGMNWYSILGGDGMECLVDYTDEDVIYAEYYYGSVYRSVNGGYSFVDIKPSGTGNGAWVTPYIIDPSDNNTLYIGFLDVYKSTDRGNNWAPISTDLTGGENLKSLAIAPSNSLYVYAATSNGIWKTSNGGNSWSNINSNLPGNSIKYIAVSQNNPDLVWVALSGYDAGEKVYKSSDGGTSWTNYSNGLPNLPVNCITYEHNTNHGLYVGTDIGVYYRNNSMSAWVSFNNGLPNVIVNELEIHYPTDKIRAATYGRGVWESELYLDPAVPVGDFSHTIISSCMGEVSFSDITAGVPDVWHWDFGDGDTSTDQNPIHNYDSFGTYTVELIVSNSFGSDTVYGSVVLSASGLNADFDADNTSFCSAPATVYFSNLTSEASSFFWDFGDGNTSTDNNPYNIYLNSGSYDVMLVASSLLCENDTLQMNAYIDIDPLNSVSMNMGSSGSITTECCSGTLKDNGGDGNYLNNTTSYFIISPTNAEQVTVTFNMFDVEPGDAGYCNFDYIALYDGPNLAYPLIGTYCNTTGSPGTITSTGGTLTIKQYSDGGVEGAGFELDWSCIVSSIDESNQEIGFDIFPNPSDGVIGIRAENPGVKQVELRILDITGRIVDRKVMNVEKTKIDLEYNFGDKKGLYLIEMKADNLIFRKKLIVQ